jgi:hypothetical protein
MYININSEIEPSKKKKSSEIAISPLLKAIKFAKMQVISQDSMQLIRPLVRYE